MKSSFKTILVISLLTFISSAGCASMINGSAQRITIDSNVQGADIYFNGKPLGTTPFTGVVPRGNDSVITISKSGYVSKTVVLNTSIDPWFALNIFWGGAGTTGSTTDHVNGSMYRYSPNRIHIDLYSEDGGQRCKPVRTCPKVQCAPVHVQCPQVQCPPVIVIVK